MSYRKHAVCKGARRAHHKREKARRQKLREKGGQVEPFGYADIEAADRIEQLSSEVEALKHDLVRVMKRENEYLNQVEQLSSALADARDAIASLEPEALGMAQIPFGTPGVDMYPIRDELLATINSALQSLQVGGE
jgi:DNA repair exonuclease SbcCD ATPase subunit